MRDGWNDSAAAVLASAWVSEPAQSQLGRVINPTLYTRMEFRQRFKERKAFLTRVLAQPKILIKGSEDDITRLCGAGESGADRTA